MDKTPKEPGVQPCSTPRASLAQTKEELAADMSADSGSWHKITGAHWLLAAIFHFKK